MQVILEVAKNVLQQESKAIEGLIDRLNEHFEQVVRHILQSSGKVVATGIGKSAIIAQKFVATLNSTGTPAAFLHAAEALHGDIGMVHPNDTVFFLSKSGETNEVKQLLPLIQQQGCTTVAMTANPHSFLAQHCDYFLDVWVEREACPNNLAPTTSTTATLALCDAIAVALIVLRNFTAEDFARLHPGGSLGKRLYLRVKDLCHRTIPVVEPSASLYKVVEEMTSKRLGCTLVMEKGKLLGIITDGDLRRWMKRNLENFIQLKHWQQNPQQTPPKLPIFDQARSLMTPNPKTIHKDVLAYAALQKMEQHQITQLVVLDDQNQVYGILHMHDILKEGIL